MFPIYEVIIGNITTISWRYFLSSVLPYRDNYITEKPVSSDQLYIIKSVRYVPSILQYNYVSQYEDQEVDYIFRVHIIYNVNWAFYIITLNKFWTPQKNRCRCNLLDSFFGDNSTVPTLSLIRLRFLLSRLIWEVLLRGLIDLLIKNKIVVLLSCGVV